MQYHFKKNIKSKKLISGFKRLLGEEPNNSETKLSNKSKKNKFHRTSDLIFAFSGFFFIIIFFSCCNSVTFSYCCYISVVLLVFSCWDMFVVWVLNTIKCIQILKTSLNYKWWYKYLRHAFSLSDVTCRKWGWRFHKHLSDCILYIYGSVLVCIQSWS